MGGFTAKDKMGSGKKTNREKEEVRYCGRKYSGHEDVGLGFI